MRRRHRVAYLVTHPIQYQAPLLRFLARSPELDLTALFLTDMSVRRYRDREFGRDVEWDVPLLDGYVHEVLPALGSRDRLTGLRPLSLGLGSRLHRGRFDAVWVHGYAHPVLVRAMALARRRGLGVLLRGESHLDSHARGRMRAMVKSLVLRRLFRLVDAFLTIGSLNRAYYRFYGVADDRLFDVPYAVDNQYFQRRAAACRPRRERLRAELGLDPERRVILFAAKLVPRKRPGDLLEAHARLAGEGLEPAPHLLFAGDGSLRDSLERRAAAHPGPSVRFLGFRNQSELPALYDLCDVFVLPSEREPWGLAVNEAMNAGKPIIASDRVGAGPDLIRPGENGYVFPVGDIPSLTEALRSVLRDGDRAARMGERSRELVEPWDFRSDEEGLLAALAATVGGRSRGESRG